jgi:hypothetical protein
MGTARTAKRNDARDVARELAELPDVPAIAVCATCGDPGCPGHDLHEVSGERPIHRSFAWEDGETPALRALWRTAMASASDVDLWIRASTLDDAGVAPAFTFALAVEIAAVAATCVPLAIAASIATWSLTHDRWLATSMIALVARVGAVFVPVMIAVHVVYQAMIARGGARRGRAVAGAKVLRAGLFSCGWDLATGPLGVLAPAIVGRFAEARARWRGNSELFKRASDAWLSQVHGVEGAGAEAARRGTWPWLMALVLVAVALVGWAFVATFG